MNMQYVRINIWFNFNMAILLITYHNTTYVQKSKCTKQEKHENLDIYLQKPTHKYTNVLFSNDSRGYFKAYLCLNLISFHL